MYKFYKPQFHNPYYSGGGYVVNQDLVSDMLDSYKRSMYLPMDKKRSLVGRAFDVLGTSRYLTQGVIRSFVDEDLTTGEAIVNALKSANPFGEGFEEGKYTFSGTLGELGWQPESIGGKLARGAVGLAGDIFLDPLTYINWSVMPLLKGSGSAGAEITHSAVEYAGKAVDVSKGLNLEVAKKIVTEKYGNALNAGEILKEAKNFVEKYNKIIGVGHETKNITLSLAHAPFGKKIFGSLADKSIELVSAETLINIGDKYKIYSRLRDSVYGSHLGNLFGKGTALYNASKENPEKVYSILQYFAHSKGAMRDKRLAEQTIRSIVEQWNLTPDDNNQLIEILEDKEMFKKVVDTVDFLDEKELAIYKMQVEELRSTTLEQLSELKEMREQVELFKAGRESRLIDSEETLNKIESSMSEALNKLNTKYLGKSEALNKATEVYTNEIQVLQHELSKEREKFGVVEPKELVSRFKEYSKRKSLKDYDAKFEEISVEELQKLREADEIKLDTLLAKPDTVTKHYHTRMMNSLNKQGYVEYKTAVSAKNFLKNYPDWQKEVLEDGIIRLHPSDTVKELLSSDDISRVKKVVEELGVERENLIKDLSMYITGRPDSISFTVYDRNINELIEYIEEGASIDTLHMHLLTNEEYFSGKASTMYSFIAKELGYGSGTEYPGGWVEVKEKMLRGGLEEKVSQGVELTLEEQFRYNEYLKLHHKRYWLLTKFKSAQTTQDVKDVMTQIENEKLLELSEELRDLSNNPHQGMSKSDFMAKKSIHDRRINAKNYLDDLIERGAHPDEIGYAKHNLSEMLKADDVEGIEPALTESLYSVKENIKDSITNTLKEDFGFTKVDDKLINKIAVKHEDLRIKLFHGKPDVLLDSRQKEILQIRAIQSQDANYMSKVREGLLKDIFESRGVTRDKLTKGQLGWLNEVTVEHEKLRNTLLEGAPDLLLTDKQKDFLRYRAINSVNKVDKAKAIAKKVELSNEELMRHITEKINRNIKRSEIKDVVRQGMEVSVDYKGFPIRGVVTNITEKGAELNVHLLSKTGKVDVFPVDSVTKIFKDTAILSPEELAKSSPIINDYVSRIDDYKNLLEQTKSELEALDVDKLIKEGTKVIREKYMPDIDKYRSIIIDMQEAQRDLMEALKINSIEIVDLTHRLDSLDKVLISNDTLLDYIANTFGSEVLDTIYFQRKVDMGKIVLDDEIGISDKVKDLAKFLREEFETIGKEEVAIGKLTQEQFDGMLNRYLPHILTEDGKKLFSKKDVWKRIPGFSGELGYGRVFNPYAMSRTLTKIPIKDDLGNIVEWIENPNVLQANQYLQQEFGDILKGANAFSEDIADIFLLRAMKHNDLMYDYKYMDVMTNVFGNVYEGGVVSEGYKSVYNFGRLKNYSNEVASTQTSLDISDAISNYIDTGEIISLIENRVIARFKEGESLLPNSPIQYKKMFNEELSKEIQGFIESVFPKDVREYMRDDYLKKFLVNTDLQDALGDLAMPLIEVNNSQYSTIFNNSSYIKKRLLQNIKGKKVVATSYTDKFGEVHKTYKYKGGLFSYIQGKSFESGLINADNSKLFEKILNMNGAEVRKEVERLKQWADDIDMGRLERFLKKLDSYDKLDDIGVKEMYTEIVDKANQVRKLQIQKDNSRFLQIYDKFTHLLKLNQTTVLPSFHSKQKLGSMFNNWLAVGEDVLDFDMQKKTYETILKKGDVTGALEILTEEGLKEVSWKELYEMAFSNGVIRKGMFAQELGADKTAGVLSKLGRAGALDPTDTRNFFLYKTGSKIGTALESQDRFLHFVSQLKRGMSVDNAVESVNKFLFDYSDLTMFEQSVMKRIIPFYTFMRKNAPLQLEMMLTEPKKYLHISQIIGGMRNFVDEDEMLNTSFLNDFALDWVQLPFYVKNPYGREEPVMLNPGLPYMSLNKFSNLYNLKNLIGDVNPLIKVPIEQAMNYHSFFQQPLSEEEGVKQIPSRLDHILSQFSLYTVGKGFAQKRGADLGLHLFNTFASARLLSYDYDAVRAMRIKELNEMDYNDKLDLIYKFRPKDVFKDITKSITSGFENSISFASVAVDRIGDLIVDGMPQRADEYTDALRPISQDKFERLSDEEKLMYTPPTNQEGIYYHNKAIELERSAYENVGAVKKYIWTLFDTFEIGERNKPYLFGEVTRVIDGDTFEANIEGEEKTIRLLLIDTPETVKPDVEPMPFGQEASDYAKDFLIGKDVKIYFDGNTKDVYGRMLGYVEVDGIDYSESVLEEGYAQYRYEFEPYYRRSKRYKAAERKAYDRGVGIWSLEGYAEPGVDRDFNLQIDAINRKRKQIQEERMHWLY